jgi:hypothetical protein
MEALVNVMATPASFGAALAAPDRGMVLISGEGSHHLTAQEISPFECVRAAGPKLGDSAVWGTGLEHSESVPAGTGLDLPDEVG